uniref:Protein kinase domain-containing protein n=1 Tax=Heligmosomoides polygyrus TaxID=6339 RepID=A0A8L8K9G5_HELPZ
LSVRTRRNRHQHYIYCKIQTQLRPCSSSGFRCLAVIERASSSSSSTTDFARSSGSTANDTPFPDLAEDERFGTIYIGVGMKVGCKSISFASLDPSILSSVNELLTEFDKYQALFPHSKAMEDDCRKRKGTAFTKQMLDKVTLLITWLNTVDDLASKITQLGTVFEVSRVPEGEKHWPRPLHSASWTVGLRDARPVFEAFVKRSLIHRGMKRVVARVWEVCERTVMKTAILLQPPIASYAHAASRQRTMSLFPFQMERYNEMFNYTLTSEKAKAIHLPSVGPMFIFVLGVRLELAREWLSVRSKWEIPDGAEMDVLTMDTLIEDCRDCVDEAVRAKLFFLDVIQSICPKGKKGKLCTADFDDSLKDVFQKYLSYVERWCDSVALNGDLGRLFYRLEEEWRTAFQCSLHIHSGLAMLSSSFWYVPDHEDRSVDETDNGYDRYAVPLFVAEIGQYLYYSQTKEQTTMFDAFRAYNSVIREVKERSARLVALLRGALLDLHDAAGYVVTQPLETVLSESVAVCVLVDSASADKALAQDLVTALAEGRRPDIGKVILHRDVCRYVGDSYLAEFGSELASRGLDVIHQWKELVTVMKPQPSPHIPLWASHAFNFIHFLTDPKYTEYLLDIQFQVSCLLPRATVMNLYLTNLSMDDLGSQTILYISHNSRESLAGGTFGTVYKALNVDAQCVIAVKEIRVKRDVLKILQGEVDILRNLSHKNLVKYYGCEDEVLIMMEYCSEGTLERVCREGLDEELVRRYTNSLLRAVAYMHSQKIVHRDIKPANIFLDLHCVLKLGDFGCSVRLHDQATVYGEIAEYAGTVQYMAPEVLTYGGMTEDGKYRGYGRAIDIWSIGCVVLEMLKYLITSMIPSTFIALFCCDQNSSARRDSNPHEFRLVLGC